MGAVNVQIADTVRLGGAGWESNSSAMLKTFMFWLRCLSVDEIAWLHAEPYAMFEPPNLEVFYSIPSGVPTFNPAWAMNSNQVLYV